MKIVTNLEECKILWEKYSPKNTLWDEWDIVTSFYDPNLYFPYFMEFDFGLLPLWFEKKEKKYYFFGGTFPEGRKFWFDLLKFKEVYDVMPTPIKLFDMDGDYVDEIISKFHELNLDIEIDHSYFIDLKSLNWDINNYLSNFSKKHKYNLLYDIKKSEEKGIVKEWDKFLHFEKMAEFNVKRFAEESDFYDKDFSDEIKLFFSSIDKRDELFGLYIKKDDKIIGLEYGAFSHGIYYVLNGGYSLDFPNVGKVLIMSHIQKAIELKANEIDFLTGDTGWKKMWNLSQKKRITIKKNE